MCPTDPTKVRGSWLAQQGGGAGLAHMRSGHMLSPPHFPRPGPRGGPTRPTQAAGACLAAAWPWCQVGSSLWLGLGWEGPGVSNLGLRKSEDSPAWHRAGPPEASGSDKRRCINILPRTECLPKLHVMETKP